MATFDHNRTYGIEIEMSWGRENRPAQTTVARALMNAGLMASAAGYTHDVSAGWKVVSDGSVSNGWEIVSPILSGLNGKEQLKAAMRAVKEIGAITHASCGIHVHHGVHDFTAKQLANIANIYANNEEVIDQLVAPSRRGDCQWAQSMKNQRNGFYAPSVDPEVPYYDAIASYTPSMLPPVPWQSDQTANSDDRQKKSRLVQQLAPGGRYYKVNFHSYLRQGTVEFRQHQSSLNAIKIWDWVVFTQMVVTTAKNTRGKARQRIINQGNVSTRKERGLVRDLRMRQNMGADEITMASMRRLMRRRDGMGFNMSARLQNGVRIDIDDSDDSDVADASAVHAAVCTGHLVERTNRNNGEHFMGCSEYRRGCRFTTQVVAATNDDERRATVRFTFTEYEAQAATEVECTCTDPEADFHGPRCRIIARAEELESASYDIITI